MDKFPMRFRAGISITLLVTLMAGLAIFPRPALAANGVVGTGTEASCTLDAFETVYGALDSGSGGTMTFNCGPAPVSFILLYQHPIQTDLVIDGGGLVTLSGGNTTMLFQVYGGHTLTLNNITLSHAHGNPGAVENFGTLNANHSQFLNNDALTSGGAILNHSTMNLDHVIFTNNTADAGYGGAIFSDGGSVSVDYCTFTTNTAFSGGGGIGIQSGSDVVVVSNIFNANHATDTFAQGGAIVNISGSLSVALTTFYQNFSSRGGAVSVLGGTAGFARDTFTGNYSAYGGGVRQEGGTMSISETEFTGNGYAPNGTGENTGGGGISFYGGDATLDDVTISNGYASYGAGFDHVSDGTATLTNVTISGNKGGGGGGFNQSGGTVVLINDTITVNSGSLFAAGIANRGGTLSLTNTLLSGNQNATTHLSWDCYAPVTTASFSMSTDASCGFGPGHDNQILPMSPLAPNGGFTLTQLLKKGNPAIDGGTDAGCPTNDQRGVIRPQGQACDVGAVEMTRTDFGTFAFLSFISR